MDFVYKVINTLLLLGVVCMFEMLASWEVEAGEKGHEFEANLCYIVNSRAAWARK
jgi:hypothetical protein